MKQMKMSDKQAHTVDTCVFILWYKKWRKKFSFFFLIISNNGRKDELP